MTRNHTLQLLLQLGTQITYQQAGVDAFAESLGQNGNTLFKEHCRAATVEAQEGVFAGTNSIVAQISLGADKNAEVMICDGIHVFLRINDTTAR